MMQYVKNISALLCADRKAVTAIEYSLIAALVAVVIIGAVTAVGGGITGTMTAVANAI
jgi:pilus assembly protein Flp/PilA